MKHLSEPEAEDVMRNKLDRIIEDDKAAILITFEDPGIMAIGFRASGKMHLRAALQLLRMMDNKSAPAKVRHHVQQALAELRQARD